VQTLTFNIGTNLFQPPLIADVIAFSQLLRISVASFTNLRRLELLWAGRNSNTGPQFGRPRPYVPPKATTALDTLGPIFVELWEHIAPTLLELRVDVYVDAIETVSVLNGRLARELTVFDLRVYGTVYPTDITFGAIGRQFEELARNLILPMAERLQTSSLCFVPCDGQDSVSPPKLHVDGFFRVLASTRFPKLRALSIEVPFLALEARYIASFVASHTVASNGGLESLFIAHTSPRGWGDTSQGIATYRKLLREHGSRWSGLRTLSLWVPPTIMQSPRDNSFMLPLLGANPALYELNLASAYLPDAEDLRVALEALHPGRHLRKLTVAITLVRPSLFDALARFAPELEYLRLEYSALAPDGPPPSTVFEDVLKEASARNRDSDRVRFVIRPPFSSRSLTSTLIF
jgi:hypothetical protein